MFIFNRDKYRNFGVLLLQRTLTLTLTLNQTLTLTLTLTRLFSYPHGNEMKGYGSCMFKITISDFWVRESRFYLKFYQQLFVNEHIHPQFVVGIYKFLVLCCDVSYDYCMETMSTVRFIFAPYLFVLGLMSYLCCLCVVVCSGVWHDLTMNNTAGFL